MSLSEQLGDLKTLLQSLDELDREQREAKREAEHMEDESLDDRKVDQQVTERFTYVTQMVKSADNTREKVEDLAAALAAVEEDDDFQRWYKDGQVDPEHFDTAKELAEKRGEMIDDLVLGLAISHTTAKQLQDLVQYQQRIYDDDRVFKQVEKITNRMLDTHEKLVEKQVANLEEKIATVEQYLEQEKQLRQQITRLEEENERLEDQVAEYEEQHDQSRLDPAVVAKQQDYTDDQAQALALLRADVMKQSEIADVIGVDEPTITRWKKTFKADDVL